MSQFSINPVKRGSSIDGSKTTGRYIAVVKNFQDKKIKNTIERKTSLRIASSNDYNNKKKGFSVQAFNEGAQGLYLQQLGVIVLDGKDAQLMKRIEDDKDILVMRPEQKVYALNNLNPFYMQGYFDAVKHLYEKSLEPSGATIGASSKTERTDLALSGAWHLEMTNVLASKYSGKGVNLAVLDTGFDFDHPDFANRSIQSAFFAEGATSADDRLGHGTHCAGIAAGPKTSSLGERYGVAFEANLFVGKVLNDNGEGTDGSLTEGIEWAISNNCKIISMSLGGSVEVTDPFQEMYETIARRALQHGTIIIAAAGNDSDRPGNIVKPVNSPANCPSILSVGAISRDGRIADFSCGTLDLFSCGSSVDLVAPGVDIRSSYIGPQNYFVDSGTSMATPLVSGIAALVAEAYPDMPAMEFRNYLTRNAKSLNLSPYDSGCGLVQAI
ncbi:S8 family peptidase [Dyadobacter fanqingshengii]|uniref:S8 family serine peptidase n=1 Tax=Dyadobacter fanqingshengii TaxID=2906443 RepID=A0A9X1PAL9_9BACT|nr:S8 family serine peptidase [Dyadobacter fanqingshengii]MCF0039792.1 S8 family serine peptidase [Dyadobacter fanqingshengii]USJ38445.1 S8 family serine peptidase [Dyadobacter fanqingshengii]